MLSCLFVAITISHVSFTSEMLFIKNDLFVFMRICLSLFVCHMCVVVSQRSQNNVEPSEVRVTGGSEPSRRCWESNPSPLKE